MRPRCRPLTSFLVLLALVGAGSTRAEPLKIRVATYNCSLNRNAQGQLATDLATGANTQARQVAEILQRVRPDIVLLNEFDVDPTDPTLALTRFHDNYLAVAQNGQGALNYPFRYAAPSNTGVASGFDLDNNGSIVTTPGSESYGNDCFGFGVFPGQYSFVVYSRFPIQTSAIRTFLLFKWRDMPGAVIPDDPATPPPFDWYSPAELNVFRISSKNHVDLPIEIISGQILHLLASHPTPPSFDGTEDRNGRRNRDEIRLWADYIRGASYLRDDAGVSGGLADDQRFVILGDLNADPLDGDSFLNSIRQLREHPRINATFDPASPGGPQQSQLQGGINGSHRGDPAFDTSDFNDNNPGNLRLDHILPSKLGLSVADGAVFWPLNSDPTFPLVAASDHRLVYLDLNVLPIPAQAVKEFAVETQGPDFILTWKTQPGVNYVVEQSTDLTGWSANPAIVVTLNSENGTAMAIDTGGALEPGGRKFYRLALSIDGSAPVVSNVIRTKSRASKLRRRRKMR